MFHVEPLTKETSFEPPNQCLVCYAETPRFLFLTSDWFLTHEEFAVMKCNSCHSHFTWPQPDISRLGNYYKSEDYVSHSNTRKGIVNSLYQIVRNVALNNKYKLIARYADKGTLLDIGCGTGHFLNHFNKNGWQVEGIEPGEAARNHAKEVFGLSVHPEEALDTFEKQVFDVITMWHVLEHVPNPHTRLKQVKQLLKPNGLALFALPNPDAWDAKHYGEYWAAWDVPRHLYHFNRDSFKYLLEQHGFELMKTLPMPFDAYYVSMLSEKYKTGKTNLVKALLNGFRSNRYASRTGNASSHIYLAKINQ